MATELNTKLGRDLRLYVGKTAAATADADFTRVTNENDVKFKITAATTDLNMKENGGQVATTKGAKSYEISAELARVYNDLGGAALAANVGEDYPVQLRQVTYDENGDVDEELVALEGKFIITDAEFGAPVDGAQTITFTLKGAGNVKNQIMAPRVLTA